jgi:hypothetical protein
MDDLDAQDKSKTKTELVQDAWAAARHAVQAEDRARSQQDNWSAMWVALAIAGLALLALKLLIR